VDRSKKFDTSKPTIPKSLYRVQSPTKLERDMSNVTQHLLYGSNEGRGEESEALLHQHERQASMGRGKDVSTSSYNRIATLMIFLFPAMGGLLFGYDIGATSAVVTQLKSSVYSGVMWSDAVSGSSFLQGTITSVSMLGAMLGSATCFAVADMLGRRRSLLLASCLYCIGSVLEALSGSPDWRSSIGITVLLIGRLIYGYGCGFAMHGAPAYIGEMAPSEIRGLLVSLKEAFIVLGMVFGYIVGYLFQYRVGGWRLTYGVSSIFAVAMFCGMYYLPPSARWLALKGRASETKQSLRFVTPNISDAEIDSIMDGARKAAQMQSNTSPDGNSGGSDWKRLTAPTVWPALVAGVGLVFLQQVTGQPSVLFYADSIFADIGLNMVASIGVSVFKLVATLFATFTVDNYGRKLLLYIGCSLMLGALLMLGTAFMFDYTSASECNSHIDIDTCPSSSCSWNSDYCGTTDCTAAGFSDEDCQCCGVSGINAQKAVILTALFVYIGGYQVGFGPIAWLIISEIFPLEVRGKAVSIAVVTNFFWNTIMSFFFPVELEFIGPAATFYIYAVILAWGIYFIFYKVPETKGLSLEEIEDFFLRTSRVNAQNLLASGNGTRGPLSGEKSGDNLKLSPVL